jgi:tetratricopeptide (TPR) repeat protein
MATISEALALAVQHHQAGRLQAAQQIYRQVLAAEPNQADAWHLLGVVAFQLGKHEAAVEQISRAIALNGAVAAFHSNLGNAFQGQGKTNEAIACYRRALELDPRLAETHNNLGNVLKEQGKLQEAVACYRRALELAPNYADAHYNLGLALHDQGRTDEATACYRRVLQFDPAHARAHNNLGNALQGQGNLDEAIACYQRALELNPAFAQAHYNLGNAYNARNQPDQAAARYRRALELQPNYAEAINNLGGILHDQGKLDEAIASYRRTLELKPASSTVYNNLGRALHEQGEIDQALACFRRALELNPAFAGAENNLGNALRDLGHLAEAEACYRRVLQLERDRLLAGCQSWIDGSGATGSASARRPKGTGKASGTRQSKIDGTPGPQDAHESPAAGQQSPAQARPKPAETDNSLGNAFLQLATLLQGRLPEDERLLMQQMLSEANLHDDGRAAMEFAMSRVLEAQDDFQSAADHLAAANALRLAVLRKQGRDYSPARHAAFVRDTLAVYTPEFFARTNGFGLETELPVFIVGLPRSGTTLVEQILASHSSVFGAGELRYCEETFQSLPAAMQRHDAPLGCLRAIDRETARALAQRHLDRLRTLDARALRVVDKTPENYHHLGLVRLLFPRARLIHCRRELRDVALSCWTTNFAALPWSFDQEQILSHFEQYSRLMAHWRQTLHAPPLEVDYEELVRDTESVARRIVQWCGLEWEAACLRFHESPRPVRTASAIQVRRPIYTGSVGRWKNYAKPLGEWFEKIDRLATTAARPGEPVAARPKPWSSTSPPAGN